MGVFRVFEEADNQPLVALGEGLIGHLLDAGAQDVAALPPIRRRARLPDAVRVRGTGQQAKHQNGQHALRHNLHQRHAPDMCHVHQGNASGIINNLPQNGRFFPISERSPEPGYGYPTSVLAISNAEPAPTRNLAGKATEQKAREMERRTLLLGGAATLLAGCSGQWSVDYEQGLDPAVTRAWRTSDILVAIPSDLTVSNSNTYAPNADIVWHGEPFGDRRAQVGAILTEGIKLGAQPLQGKRQVTIATTLAHFHAVTPAAVARAPAAVHNISYYTQVLDSETGQPLTERQLIQADLEAYVGPAAVAAAIEGQNQRTRIVQHISRVTRGWLGYGPDQRRTFNSIGR